MSAGIDRQALCATMAMSSLPISQLKAANATSPIIVNALGSLYDPNISSETFDLLPRVLKEAAISGLTAVNMTLGAKFMTGDAFEPVVRNIAAADRIVRDHAAATLKVWCAADMQRAKAENKIGLIFGFQDLEMIAGDSSRVDIFADMGVRVFQLTYNGANREGAGAATAGNAGLTPFGREVIARLNDRRVMVDLSHSDEQTCLDAIAASRTPISINHTGCRALVDLPRNKTDAELRMVANRGGFVGIYFMLFLAASGHATAADVVAHIDHAVNVCGEDHVGIGTDGPITQIDDLQAYALKNASEITARKAAGLSAAGERRGAFPFVVDLRGPDQFHRLARLLKGKGYSWSRIEKILGLNFLRYAKDVWG